MVKASETVLLYGPPCSGKSTIARHLEEKLGWRYVSIGALTRDEINRRTPTGLRLKHCLESVVEYPLDLIAGLVEKELEKTNGVVILDGYPKYSREAERFVRFALDKGTLVNSILLLEADLATLLGRVTNRRICVACHEQMVIENSSSLSCCVHCGGSLALRDDDEDEAFRRRYDDYQTSIAKTLDDLQVLGVRRFHIDACQSRDEVIQTILRFFPPK